MWAIFSMVLLSDSLKGRRMKTRMGRLRLPIAQPPQTLPLWLGMRLEDLFVRIVGFGRAPLSRLLMTQGCHRMNST